MTYEALPKQLSDDFCILVGAGISYPSPSSLPPAQKIIDTFLSSLLIAVEDKEILKSSASPDSEHGLGYFDYLRFEQIMEAYLCSFYNGDELIDKMIPPVQPNSYHFKLAHLIAKGHIILTTNFDCLIEEACQSQGISYSVLAKEEEFREYIEHPEKFPNPILKLHGTIYRSVRKKKSTTLSATLESVITQRTLCPQKWEAVDKIFAAKPLLVMGYSGNDDYDVMPAISFTSADQHLVWIQHTSSDHVMVCKPDREKYPENFEIGTKLDIFFEDMFGIFTTARTKRSVNNTLIVNGPTEKILDFFFPETHVSINTDLISTDQAEHIEILTKYIQSILGSNTPYVLLFISRLFKYIGKYSKAIIYLEKALILVKKINDPLVTGRINAALAQIWRDRDESYKAHLCMVKAREKFLRLKHLHPKDIDDLLDFTVHLDVDPFVNEIPYCFKFLDEKTLQYMKLQYNRRLLLFKALRHVRMGEYKQAFSCLTSGDNPKFLPEEFEFKADFKFTLLCVERANNIIRSVAGFQKKGGWDNTDYNYYDQHLSDIRRTYELLQKKAMWARALLYQAEEYMWAMWPDWAEESAFEAFFIFDKIGNEKGVKYCNQLVNYIDANAERINGPNYYRINDTRPYEAFADKEILDTSDLKYFCPSCLQLVTIRIATCLRCGYRFKDPNTPITTKDFRLTPAEKTQLFLSILANREVNY